MFDTIRPALVFGIGMTVLLGIAYPLGLTGIAQVVAPKQANGSLITNKDGQVIGSSLIGQSFASPKYFWSRPSAAGKEGYDATASSGSNLGPTSKALMERLQQDIETNRVGTAPVPPELVTASGSGLDPEISPAAAMYQVPRVAAARGKTEAEIRALVEAQVKGRALGLIGEPIVNVLALNLSLDPIDGRAGH